MNASDTEILRLQRENARLKSDAEMNAKKRSLTDGLRMAVSPKGGVSIYGFGRFPVTLYRDQWERIIDGAAQLKKFLEDNADRLKGYKEADVSYSQTSEGKSHAGIGEANG